MSAKEFAEHYTRLLQAKRDFPAIDHGEDAFSGVSEIQVHVWNGLDYTIACLPVSEIRERVSRAFERSFPVKPLSPTESLSNTSLASRDPLAR